MKTKRAHSRRGPQLFLVAAAVVLTALILLNGAALAMFTTSSGVGSNSTTFDVLDPAPTLGAAGGPTASLSWTATPDTYASGHRVFRGTASGGPYSQIAQVTPRTTTSYIDSPASGTYYYVVRAYFQNWESVNSNEAWAVVTTTSSTGYLACSANAAVTSGSGDNNGYQLNPANACADDASFAEDTNSGSGTTNSCSNTGKDRHLYYNYGASIPAGSTINGIELRLDAWADATAGTPYICAELSWNGGSSWTSAKTTANLTTAQATYTLGAVTDTWGRSWAVSDFTNANFRVRLTDVATNTNRDFRLDYAAVQVTYTPP